VQFYGRYAANLIFQGEAIFRIVWLEVDELRRASSAWTYEVDKSWMEKLPDYWRCWQSVGEGINASVSASGRQLLVVPSGQESLVAKALGKVPANLTLSGHFAIASSYCG